MIEKHYFTCRSALRARISPFLFLVLLPVIAAAQVPTTEPSTETPGDQQKIQELEKKIEELDQRVKADEGQQVKAAAVAADAAKSGIAVTFGANGVNIRSNDDNIEANIGADLQIDGRFYPDGVYSPASDGFLIRRARPTFSGVLYKYVDFFIRPDFGLGTTVLYDAYVDMTYFSRFVVRAGKFKPPVGLERLQSDDDTTFIERGLPTLLVPSRDIGYQISGDVIKSRVNYAVGVFNGVADNSLSDAPVTSHRDFAARLFLTPFQPDHNVLSGLGLGVAGSEGPVDGLPLPAYKTLGQITFFNFSSGVASDGHRTRLAPQMYYYLRGFGVLSEYTRADEDFQKGIVRHPFDLRAWQVAVSYLLTGEKKGFGTLVPRKNFDPANHTWGALELALRVGDFEADRALFNDAFASITTSPRRVHEWLGGVNWYLNRYMEIKFNAGNTNFVGGAVATLNGGDRPSERTLLTRFQLNF